MTSKYGERWSRDESILALYLYCQIPFSKTKANNPEVIRLANLLRRTPASVARKLGNFGAFDPLLAKQGISGLTHTGKAAKQIWDEFHNQWETLVEESTRLIDELSATGPAPEAKLTDAANETVPNEEIIVVRPSGPSERQALAPARRFQAFFRRAVLASYETKCCICGLDIRPLLVASHIKPWAVDESTRSDPENGLCLCAIHDKAFDRRLITVSNDLCLLVHPKIMESNQAFVRATLVSFHRQPIRLPRRFPPRYELLAWHRERFFDPNGQFNSDELVE